MKEPEQPLTPAVFYILLALAPGRKHGYGIMRETRRLSDDTFRMGPATLYTTIQRLLELSMIEEIAGPADADSRRRSSKPERCTSRQRGREDEGLHQAE
jgi:Fe2+ or Zn2+ uptake regulation protein